MIRIKGNVGALLTLLLATPVSMVHGGAPNQLPVSSGGTPLRNVRPVSHTESQANFLPDEGVVRVSDQPSSEGVVRISDGRSLGVVSMKTWHRSALVPPMPSDTDLIPPAPAPLSSQVNPSVLASRSVPYSGTVVSGATPVLPPATMHTPAPLFPVEPEATGTASLQEPAILANIVSEAVPVARDLALRDVVSVDAEPLPRSSATVAEQIPLPELPMPGIVTLQPTSPEPIEQVPVVTQPEMPQTLVAQQELPPPVNEQPPVALPVAPPPPADVVSEPETNEDISDEARLARRVAELNRPLTRIDLAAVTTDGPQPKDLAATQSSQLPPILVWGGDGWAEPPADRYPEYFAYQPLYFEERNLERCGEGYGFAQPLFSSAHFLKNTIALPYHLIASPPRSLVQTPGDCPTCHRFPHTWSE